MFVHALPRPWRHDLRDIGDVHVCICHSCDFNDVSPFQTPGTCGLTNVLVYVIFPSIWNTCMYSAPCFNYEWITDFAKALLFKESTLTHKYITCLIWFNCVSLFRKKVNLASYIPSPNLPFASKMCFKKQDGKYANRPIGIVFWGHCTSSKLITMALYHFYQGNCIRQRSGRFPPSQYGSWPTRSFWGCRWWWRL